MKSILRKYKFVITILSICCIGIFISATAHQSKVQNNTIRIETYKTSKSEFAISLDKYIKTVAPKSTIDTYKLITLCEKYNVDVIFVVAQGQLESHFATKGTAKKTKSIFNVGAYDGYSANRQIKNGFGFKDPNDSIEPFLKLLTAEYLVNGKTIDDLFVNYVNFDNKRYASNKRYEKQLNRIYNKILSIEDINIVYNNYLTHKNNVGHIRNI